MTRYRWDGTQFVNRATGEPMQKPYGISAPRVQPDIQAYVSPLGDGVIEGRFARREHLKRNGCREADPSEFKPTYLTERMAKRMGREWDQDAAKARDRERAERLRDRLNEAAHDTADLMYGNRN